VEGFLSPLFLFPFPILPSDISSLHIEEWMADQAVEISTVEAVPAAGGSSAHFAGDIFEAPEG
jgi:hypothetical protein